MLPPLFACLGQHCLGLRVYLSRHTGYCGAMRASLGRPPSTAGKRRWIAFLCALAVTLGCTSTQYVKLRSVPRNPLVDQLKLTARGGPRPTERTEQLLRQYDLDRSLNGPPEVVLASFQQVVDQEPSPEKLYSYAELNYLAGKRLEHTNPPAALDRLGAAVSYAYLYLFDDRFASHRNPYDPQFRGACDVYNAALESTLRIVRKQGMLMPGKTYTIETASQAWHVTVVARGADWLASDFERFEFVSDYEVQGLKNQYRSYGLGVPLIAVRRPRHPHDPRERFYPPNLSFPVTAFVRLLPPEHNATPGTRPQHRALLELYDPLTTSETTVGQRIVPLETDLSTPLAYFLNNPQLDQLATAGLLRVDKSQNLRGLYMVQPYEPGKIPVIMVHGLWSSPLTWMEMFNDLRGDPIIRRRFQFWFYLYPTGQPFWESAAQFRQDLAQAREILDPQHLERRLDQIILVGHSMGGLVSKLQTVESGNAFWQIVSDQPFAAIKAPPEIKRQLEQEFFFQPNPSIRRVITIGTPHRGSPFASETARYLARKLITLPELTLTARQQVVRDNRDLLRNPDLLETSTSLDSLSPASPMLPVLLAAPKAPWVRYHNIVGVIQNTNWLGKLAAGSDGVVAYESAHLDDVSSELVVNADHSHVHRHPLSVLEVRRILLEHAAEMDAELAARSAN